MKKYFENLMVVIIVFFINCSDVVADGLDTRVFINGEDIRVFNSAVLELEKNGLDANAYKVFLIKKKDRCVVVFLSKDGTLHQRGSSGSQPGFEVELSLDGKQVLTTQFSR